MGSIQRLNNQKRIFAFFRLEFKANNKKYPKKGGDVKMISLDQKTISELLSQKLQALPMGDIKFRGK